MFITRLNECETHCIFKENLFFRPGHAQTNIEDIKTATEKDFLEASKMEHPWLQFNLVQNTQIVQYLIENAQSIFQSDPITKSGNVYINHENSKPSEFDVGQQNPLSKR